MSELLLESKTGAGFNRGASKQDYPTPWELIHAVEGRFGKMVWDLAASEENKKAPRYIDAERDSLKVDWRLLLGGNLWLNPPFADIAPWAEKCAKEATGGASVFFLTPASVGSNWFLVHVRSKAYVLFLSPRVTFVGAKDPYPKDLILSCYFHGLTGYDTWRYK